MTSANPTAFKTAREVISSGRHRERSDPTRGNDWRREYHPYKSRNVKGNKDILEMFGVKRKLKQSEQNSREDGYEVIDCDSPNNNSDNIRSEPVHSTRNYLGTANRVKNSSLNSNGTGQSNDYRAKSAGPSLSSSSSASKEEKPSAAQPFRPPFKKPADSTSSKPGKKYGDKDKDEEFKNLVNVDEVKEIMEDTRAKNLDCGVVDRILNEIVDKSQSVRWDDISGLDIAKSNIREIVILPMIKPHLFTGLLTPTKGMLLFGPPGTGKTLIGKCIASQSNSTFFSISASSLTSKWIGEGEKLVRALFTIARIKAPSVVFIDEIDSLLTQRNDTEHESSRRMKTEFLVQFDGLNTQAEERLLVVGATNRPHELDEAARRRFTKRLYIPLPDEKARRDLLEKLLSTERHTLTQEDFDKLCERTKGYSGADISGLCKEAALGPIRRVDLVNDTENKYTTKESLPPIEFGDFEAALDSVKSSVAEKDLEIYIDWNEKYGHFQKRS